MANKIRIPDADILAIVANISGVHATIPLVVNQNRKGQVHQIPLTVDRLIEFKVKWRSQLPADAQKRLDAAIGDSKRDPGSKGSKASAKKDRNFYLAGENNDNKGIWPTVVIDNIGSVMVPGVAEVLGLKVVSKEPRKYTEQQLKKMAEQGKEPRKGLVEKYEGGIVIKYRPDYIVIGRAENVGKKIP